MQRKLFVLIRSDLPEGVKLAQACHAVAGYMINIRDGWENETIVCVETTDLDRYATKLRIRDVEFFQFHEPDLDDQATALAVYSDGKLFKSLKLVGS